MSSVTGGSLINPRLIKPIPIVRKTVGKTIADYDMIHADDHILVGVSGGKDSWSLLHILRYFQSVSPVPFTITAVTIDPGFPGFDTAAIETVYRQFPDLDWKIIRTRIVDTMRRSGEPRKNPCAFCARLRRGALYRTARETGANVIALGHHADDAIETLFISAFFEGSLVSLPPRLQVASGAMILIRPLIRVWERDLADHCHRLEIAPVSCGHESTRPQMRTTVGTWLTDRYEKFPVIRKNLLAALQNIRPGHFLDTKWL